VQDDELLADAEPGEESFGTGSRLTCEPSCEAWGPRLLLSRPGVCLV
jgi:hypothetical protein